MSSAHSPVSHTTVAHATAASPFKQPRAVWAVAFACVISFMGIGLVDPILPALSSKLHATPSQVSLLFTSYLVGPLLGGTLGGISRRGPFYGVAVLMAIALVVTVTLVRPTPAPAAE